MLGMEEMLVQQDGKRVIQKKQQMLDYLRMTTKESEE